MQWFWQNAIYYLYGFSIASSFFENISLHHNLVINPYWTWEWSFNSFFYFVGKIILFPWLTLTYIHAWWNHLPVLSNSSCLSCLNLDFVCIRCWFFKSNHGSEFEVFFSDFILLHTWAVNMKANMKVIVKLVLLHIPAYLDWLKLIMSFMSFSCLHLVAAHE